jgi:hypothetical protein
MLTACVVASVVLVLVAVFVGRSSRAQAPSSHPSEPAGLVIQDADLSGRPFEWRSGVRQYIGSRSGTCTYWEAQVSLGIHDSRGRMIGCRLDISENPGDDQPFMLGVHGTRDGEFFRDGYLSHHKSMEDAKAAGRAAAEKIRQRHLKKRAAAS